MLTGKDYVAVAKIIDQATVPSMNEHVYKARLVAELANYCDKDNPDFQRDKFFEACDL